MPLVNAKEMIEKAREGHYAVGAFNINNLEWTKAILQTAEELKAPVMLGVSAGANKYMTGYEVVAAMVKAMVESMNITVPVALHLDHGSFEGAKRALKAGYPSVMFDGSHYPFEENVANGNLLEHAEFVGNKYGTPSDYVEKLLSDEDFYTKACKDCETIFADQQGALDVVVNELKQVL